MPRSIDLTGRVVGRLTVLRRGPRKGVKTTWTCRCECGTVLDVVTYSLSKGKTKSCGCYKRDWPAENHRTHGLRKAPEYNVWAGMIQRCTNPRHRSWATYGGAGVTVCDRWLNSFEAFYEDMGPRPGFDYELDKDLRIPGNKVYGPDTCQWLLRSKHRTDGQIGKRKHRDGTLLAVVDGAEMTCVEIACKFGLSPQCVHARMKAGRTGADLIAPPDRTKRVIGRM